jgi:hypothetical protein
MKYEYSLIDTERKARNCLRKYQAKMYSELSRAELIDIITSLIILGKPCLANNFNKIKK